MSDSEKQWQDDMWPKAPEAVFADGAADTGRGAQPATASAHAVERVADTAEAGASSAPTTTVCAQDSPCAAPVAATAPYGGIYAASAAPSPADATPASASTAAQAVPASGASYGASASQQAPGTPAAGYAAAYGYSAGGVPPCGTPAPAAAQAVPAPQKKGGKGWIVGLAVVICLFLLCAIGIGSCTSMVSSSMGSLGALGSVADEVTYGDTVGVINIDGTIQYDGTTSSPEGLKAQLDRAEEDDNIVAVVLRVNSGGGVATAGEEMAIYVRDFSKPVVVSSASMNASAAYEISSQADYIYTAETTAIGSIGTAMQITDYSGLLEKLGIRIDNITSAESKDSTYGERALSEEERAYYQSMVDQINATFIQKVADGRGMTEDEVRALATGLTFTGIDAVENGLADEIGTLEDAIDTAAMLGGASSYEVMYLENYSSDLGSLLDLVTEDESQPAQGTAPAKAALAQIS